MFAGFSILGKNAAEDGQVRCGGQVIVFRAGVGVGNPGRTSGLGHWQPIASFFGLASEAQDKLREESCCPCGFNVTASQERPAGLYPFSWKPWLDSGQPVICLSTHPSTCPSPHSPTHPPIHLHTHPSSTHPSPHPIHPLTHPSTHHRIPFTCLPMHRPPTLIHPPIHHPQPPTHHPSIYPPIIYSSICPSTYPPTYTSSHPPIHLPVIHPPTHPSTLSGPVMVCAEEKEYIHPIRVNLLPEQCLQLLTGLPYPLRLS